MPYRQGPASADAVGAANVLQLLRAWVTTVQSGHGAAREFLLSTVRPVNFCSNATLAGSGRRRVRMHIRTCIHITLESGRALAAAAPAPKHLPVAIPPLPPAFLARATTRYAGDDLGGRRRRP